MQTVLPVSETIIFTEMIDAGDEALAECEAAGADRKTTAIQVYLAMEGIREIKLMKSDSETLH